MIVEGSRVVVKVNGQTTADYTDPERRFARGHITLFPVSQLNEGQRHFEFRKIEIKELPATRSDPIVETPPAAAKPQPVVPSPSPIDPKIRRAYKSFSGAWRIDGGELVQAEPVSLAQLVFGDFTWKDYDFTVDVKASDEPGAIQLYHHATGRGHNLFSVNLFDKANHYASCFELGSYTSVGNRPGRIGKDRWYRMRVRARGTHYQCFLDNEMLFEYDDQRNPQGSVGLYTSRAPARFRNIRVTDPAGQILFEGLPDLSTPPDQCFPAGGAASASQLHCLKGHEAPVNSVVFSQNGRRLLSSSSGMIHVWANQRYTRVGGPGSTLRLWDVDTGKKLDRSPLAEPVKDQSAVYHLTRPTGAALILSIVDNPRSTNASIRNVRLWGIAGDKIQERVLFPQDIPSFRTFGTTPDHRRIVAISNNGSIWDWDVNSQRVTTRQPVPALRSGYGAAAIAPNGRLALLSRANQPFAEINLATGKETGRWREGAGAAGCLAFAADGKKVLTGASDGKLRLWDVMSAKELPGFSGHHGAVHSVTFSPDGRYALSGGSDGTVRLWDLKSKKEMACFTGHTGSVSAVAFSPDGRKAASASADYTVRLWRLP